MNFNIDELPYAVRFVKSSSKQLGYPGDGSFIVSAGLFDPDPIIQDDGSVRLETSVFLQRTSAEEDIDWEGGRKSLDPKGIQKQPKLPPVAAEILPCQAILDAGLDLEQKNNGVSELHANVIGWEKLVKQSLVSAQLQAQAQEAGAVYVRPERKEEILKKAANAKPRM